MRFEFATATRILFGPGTLREVAPLAREMGSRAFVITGRTYSRAGPLLSALSRVQVRHSTFVVAGEPATDLVIEGTQRAREARCDLVISIGGGSVIDAGKAIAALATNQGDLLDYLEVIGKGRALENAPLPFIAIPTTAGTGAEVTRNAVLASPEYRVKAGKIPHDLPARGGLESSSRRDQFHRREVSAIARGVARHQRQSLRLRVRADVEVRQRR